MLDTQTTEENKGLNPADGGAAPLFILSFRHRDELAALAIRAGWHPIAARRADALERRFVDSGAQIALVDARGALDDGLAAIARLGDVAEANRAALVALVSRTDLPALDRVLAAGATHYLASPFREVELAQTLRFALRLVHRLDARRRRLAHADEPSARWRWQPGHRAVELDAGACAVLGVDGCTTRGGLLAALGPAERRGAIRAVARLLDGGGAAAFAHRIPGGELRIAHHLRMDEDGRVVGRLERLHPAADEGALDRDPLTRLATAAAARRRLASDLARGSLYLILIGLSRFDTINAAFGRLTGDALLAAAARRIDALLPARKGRRPLAARLAGAQFLVALAGSGEGEAQLLAGAILEAFTRPFPVAGQLLTLAVHLGIVADEGDGVDQLLRRASAALADARDEPGQRMLTPEGERERRAASALEVDLRRALAQDRIEILFQPQVAIATGEVVGCEALARWRHPSLGEIDAATLFAVAARSDYSQQLSRHIHRRALAEVARWPPTLGGLKIALNVTGPDLLGPNFVENAVALAAELGVPARRITLEVTEESLIADLAAAAQALAALRAAGFRIALDDFGAGYAGLSYLKALPLDTLKLDRALAQGIAGSPRDRIVARSAIDLARSLGLAVVAEGVETPEQLALLAAEGCNLYQGFLFAGPLDSVGLEARVRCGG